jgi:RNA polymerase sigma-70 factor (ECF subfamily)
MRVSPLGRVVTCASQLCVPQRRVCGCVPTPRSRIFAPTRSFVAKPSSRLVSTNPTSSPATTLDADVAELIGAGRHDAAAELVIAAYGDSIFGTMFRITRDEVVANEIYAQFLEDLWRGLPGFQGRSTLRYWCFTVAHKACKRHHRRESRRRESPMDSRIQAIAAETRSRTAPYLRSGFKEGIERVRGQLEEAERELLEYRVNQRLPFNDIAELLGEPAPRLRKRFERVKAKIRKLAEAEGLVAGTTE